MAEVQLVCVVVGVGRTFSVRIALTEVVDALKVKIRERCLDLVCCDAALYKLYLARHEDIWLNARTDEATAVEEGNVPDRIKALIGEALQLKAAWPLTEYFGSGFKPAPFEIHILVGLPQAPQSLPRAFTLNRTAEWSERFRTHQVLWSALPTLEMLQEHIKRELPEKIIVQSATRRQLTSANICQNTLNKILTVNDEACCLSLDWKLAGLAYPFDHGDTESSFHFAWDLVISMILKGAFPRAGFNRDSAHYSSTSSKRPDLLFIIDRVCVLRGEEKEPSTSIEIPRMELCDKMIWSYGHVPYVFGYAAAGLLVELYALCCRPRTAVVESHLISSFDLGIQTERFRLILALLNLSLLFQAIVQACPDSARNEFDVIRRPGGAVVKLESRHVVKRYPDATSFEKMRPMYDALMHANVRNTVRAAFHKPSKSVVLKPRGTPKIPSSLKELLCALRCVLEALGDLHSAGWMHRDIRWCNVMKRQDCEEWFLIDFDDAATSPQQYPSGSHLSEEEHAPEIFQIGSSHTTAVDLWSVGKLIDHDFSLFADFCHFEQGVSLYDQLIADNPADRQTAEQALHQLLELEVLQQQQNQRAAIVHAVYKRDGNWGLEDL